MRLELRSTMAHRHAVRPEESRTLDTHDGIAGELTAHPRLALQLDALPSNIIIRLHGRELEENRSVKLRLHPRPDDERVGVAREEDAPSALGDQLAVRLVVQRVRSRARQLRRTPVLIRSLRFEFDCAQARQ